MATVGVTVRAKIRVRFRVYLLHSLCFYQAYSSALSSCVTVTSQVAY